MTVPFTTPVPEILDVVVDATGDIEISINGGYYGEMQERTFDPASLRQIVDFAEAHKAAYDAFKASDYEDEDTYFKYMNNWNSKNE